MDKNELLNKRSALEKELSIINDKLYNYGVNQLKEQYKDKFTCEFCRYNAVRGFSCDGWSNTCGAGNDTCWHCCCEEYKPDTEVTLKIKKSGQQYDFARLKDTNGYGLISDDECLALRELGARIFEDEPTEYTLKMVDFFLENRK